MGELENLMAAGKAPKAYHASAAEYLEAIKDSHGRIDEIADRVGQARSTVRQRIRDDPEVQAAYMDEYEAVMGLAEDRLIKAIDAGEPWAIKLYLTTKGAAKGYGLKMENTGGPIVVINWNELESPRDAAIVIEGRADAPRLESATDTD